MASVGVAACRRQLNRTCGIAVAIHIRHGGGILDASHAFHDMDPLVGGNVFQAVDMAGRPFQDEQVQQRIAAHADDFGQAVLRNHADSAHREAVDCKRVRDRLDPCPDAFAVALYAFQLDFKVMVAAAV